MKELLLKEFKWNWRSFRYPAFLLVLLFFALLNPPSTKYMNELLEMFVEGMDLSIFPQPTAVDAFISYLGDISGIGILVIIFILMGSVAREKENGVTGWILSKPVSRWSYLNAKMIVHLIIVSLGVAFASAVAYLYTWSLLEQIPLTGSIWATVGLMVFMLFFAVITFALSAIMKSPLQAGGVTVFIFFITSIINMVAGELAIGRFYPNTLLSQMPLLVTGVTGPEAIYPALISTILLAALVYILAGLKFTKMEQ